MPQRDSIDLSRVVAAVPREMYRLMRVRRTFGIVLPMRVPRGTMHPPVHRSGPRLLREMGVVVAVAVEVRWERRKKTIGRSGKYGCEE